MTRLARFRLVLTVTLFVAVDALLPEEGFAQDPQEERAPQPADDRPPADTTPPAPTTPPTGDDQVRQDAARRDGDRPRRRRRRRPRRRRRTPQTPREARTDQNEITREGRRPRRRRRRKKRRTRRRRAQDRAARALRVVQPPFTGPTFQGGWRVYWMTDWHDEGAVQSFDVSLYPLRGPFRLGGSLEAGLRNEAADDDLVLRAYANVGVQRPGRVTPFAVATIGVGTIAQTRFGITDWSVLGTFGLDAGAELRIGTSFRAGASLGLLRVLARGARYDSLSIRLSLGF